MSDKDRKPVSKDPSIKKTAKERRKGLTEEQIHDFELAGGVEGGMPAGSAGGPGEAEQESKKPGGSSGTGS